ncbi:acyl-CoA dehydratase activase-related protein [Brooklawnia cerclae]|uniref:CoA-substrate-specific enzyme activase n=1 Tax=Brooklawnia cerclae TaxID=349934 RepID=A0ABX0SN20_9ACTN|nr:acyl-CoA dehydratase activase-related protein [Brooklawnia cerclae]NIH58166.1 putative CoA-substrate-specific enzyme activase [Brooklawnia cerclae]
MDSSLSLGLDVGSTTVKAVVTRGDRILFSDYRRHNADVRGELAKLLRDVQAEFPDDVVRVAMTGSGGLGVAKIMGVQFVQEVIASTAAIERLNPDVDVIIELGGEDAKITYLHPVPEQRMNGTCAGGTGAFIDQMATLLKVDASGLNELASRYENLYPIASRCGVFAKTDVQPLLNQGAAHSDIAASVFQAVATQTVAGLACGHPIRGTVIFLGGPLHFLPELRAAFQRVLGDNVGRYVTPDNGQLYVALGAAFGAQGPALSLPHLAGELEAANQVVMTTHTMRPLFADEDERTEFEDRHAADQVPQGTLDGAFGPLWLGIDAGSTTIKSVLLDASGTIVASTYGSNEGDPVAAAVGIARQVIGALPEGAFIGRTCVTGYGEDLIKAALHADEGEVETMAHFRAAAQVCPGVTSVIDIGGQDMKFLKIRGGAVDSISVNEACSSGCGSFLQTFAETMGTDVRAFAQVGLTSAAPVDLGSRCTVFMNSSVKQAQKEGASIADISAGLSYSVVRNALYKVMKLRDSGDLGDRVVVQGGTFLNDAVLRAFELQTGVQVVRPNIAGLMGAYGAALIAKAHYEPGAVSAVMERNLDGFEVTSSQRTCQLCQNHCKLTITNFDDGSRHVSGNRCERGASLDVRPKKSEVPNLYDYKYKRIFGYRRLKDSDATRGEIGIPRALGMYEDYPLWFTILTKLGFKVVVSGRSSHELFASGMESIPSENVCYPAKLAHGHVEWLLDKGIKTIFMPCVNYELKQFDDANNNYNCPIVAFYPQVLEKNLDRLHADGVRFLDPFLNLDNRHKLPSRLVEVFADWGVTLDEATAAAQEGYAELDRVHTDIRAEGDRALQYMRERGMRGIVLAGRPYHIDPEINHGIPEVIASLGMVVLSEDALTAGMTTSTVARPLRVLDQWTYHTRLYEAAGQVATQPDLNIVQLNSFGCGVDAITTDQVQEICERAGDVYTVLKIDEVSNLGAARIRLRSLQAATKERRAPLASAEIDTSQDVPVFGVAERDSHTVYVPQMSPIHFRMAEPVFKYAGLNVEVLEHASREDVECGLKYVHNDACYPAIMVIGQLINKFVSGGADPDASTVAITQTGGMCRATNYVGLLRKGLRDAGYPQVPVLAVSAQGIEQNPGFKLSAGLAHRAIQGLVLGDLLQIVLLRVRPYERDEGAAMRLYRKWDAITREYFDNGGWSPTLNRRVGFAWMCRTIVKEFDELPLLDIGRKPRVGVVGEILVKFQPDANNDAVRVIEDEGCEAVLPGLTAFFLQGMYTADYKWDTFGMGSRKGRMGQRLGVWMIEQYERPMRRALAACGGKFDVPHPITDLAEKAQQVISLGTQAGEGWLLVGEMVELIEHGTPNIICAQPFACLPNHVVGRGMFKELRRQFPAANVVSIDYDPGASEVNQLNRIKLMVATAHKVAGTKSQLAQWTDADEFGPDAPAGGGISAGSVPLGMPAV